MGSEWRAFLDLHHEWDMDTLRRAAKAFGVAVGHSEAGIPYLIAPPSATSAGEVHAWAKQKFPLINGLAQVLDTSFQDATYAARVQGPGDDHATVFASATIEIRTSAHGSLSGPGFGEPPPVSTADWDGYYERALKILGSNSKIDWVLLYKVFELLRSSAGGEKEFLRKTGLSKSELGVFTESANRPEVSGDSARHAVLGGNSSGKSMSLSEGLALMLQAMRHWT